MYMIGRFSDGNVLIILEFLVLLVVVRLLIVMCMLSMVVMLFMNAVNAGVITAVRIVGFMVDAIHVVIFCLAKCQIITGRCMVFL